MPSMEYWWHLPYSHSSSFLCKTQIADQILWDKLNMPVFVLKYSVNLKGVQRLFTVPVCNHFLTSTHCVYPSLSVTLSAWGLSRAFYSLIRFKAEAVKLVFDVFKSDFSYLKENITSQKGKVIFFLPYPPHGMSLDAFPKGVSSGGLVWFERDSGDLRRQNNEQGTDLLSVQLCHELIQYS